MVSTNTHPLVIDGMHKMSMPLTPDPSAFFNPMSYRHLQVQQHIPWRQQHLQSFQPRLPAGPPSGRPGSMWDTPEHYKNHIQHLPQPSLTQDSLFKADRNMGETRGDIIRAGDWSCNVCGNQKNFAYRSTCYRCNSPRQPRAQSTTGVRSNPFNGGQKIVSNVVEASENTSLSPQYSLDILDNRHCPDGDQVTQMEHDRLLEQEKQFDSMFEKWEENFDQWKSDNENNPDWDYVQSHIEDMNKLREKMLNRREALSRKREQLLGMEFLMEGKNNCVDCQRWKV